MASYELHKVFCTLDNGRVNDYTGCTSRCSYSCISPYRKSLFDNYVDCDQTSTKWLTLFGEQPCILDEVLTTRKMPDFQFPEFTIPTVKIPDIQHYSDESRVKPYDYQFESNTDHIDHAYNSAAVFGIVIAGVVAFMILVICLRLCISRSNARTRRERLVQLAEQLNAQSRQNRNSQQMSTRSSSSTRAEGENAEEGIIILRIRRYLCIPALRNPYRAFRNPPEPPPYDAESAPPPAYEETERLDRSAIETSPQTAGSNCTETSENPTDPPPPYTANIV